MFSQAVIEKLEFYVYFLQDPRNDETEKIDKIRDIINSGNKVKHFILRHGMSEAVSFEVKLQL